VALSLIGMAALTGAESALAGVSVDLGKASHFSVFGHSAVTGQNGSSISGSVGAQNTNADVSADVYAAYVQVKLIPSTQTIAGDLIGKTFGPGVFYSGAAIANSGVIVLDAAGNPDSVFVFKVEAALNTAAGSSVILANGAKASNVFWQTAGAITLGANSHFVGTMLSGAAITVGAGASVTGRALTHVAAITLSSNNFDGVPTLTLTPTPTPTPTPTDSQIGKAGETGAAGAKGTAGSHGATGYAGASGTDGTDGSSGVDGTDRLDSVDSTDLADSSSNHNESNTITANQITWWEIMQMVLLGIIAISSIVGATALISGARGQHRNK
jgi:hypothetical protein